MKRAPLDPAYKSDEEDATEGTESAYEFDEEVDYDEEEQKMNGLENGNNSKGNK